MRFAEAEAALPLHAVPAETLESWLAGRSQAERAWLEALGFKASFGEAVVLPGPGGSLAGAAIGLGDAVARRRDRFGLAAGAAKLPAADYALVDPTAVPALEAEAFGWLMGGYRFERYRKPGSPRERRLACPAGVERSRLETLAEAAALTQDLVNTPACDMGPEALERTVSGVAERFGARCRVAVGERLLAEGFPMIHAVGRAAAAEPRLIDLTWGPEDAPKVTLVGKGVCFDTGGLDIKPASAMALMKKDMGGAAAALGLAQAIMALGLRLRLRLLIPAVENAISGAAFRPGDILTSRKGLTVEVNNTDAEGRLVLADALALADEEAPALVVSLATLTGAARVALGPDLPPFYTDDEDVAAALAEAARSQADPLWRLPFWEPYESLIEPGIADLDNAPSGGMAGSITAALFLRRFVQARFVHLDIYAWTPTAKPARPKGAAAQGIRALLAMIEARYC
jgi:leucyl aminopeptidase